MNVARTSVAGAIPYRGLVLLVVLGGLLPFVVGCGGSGGSGSVAHWQGEVTLDGKPLPPGTTGAITLRPMDQKDAKPITIYLNEGRFDSPNIPMGKVKAFFSLEKPTGKKIHSERTGQDVEEMESIVPREAQAGIDLEVTGDDSNKVIDL